MQQLKALCGQSARSDGDRLKRLRAWCTEAEASGIRVLRDFAQQLRAYTAQTALPARAPDRASLGVLTSR
jgi:stearoyl-CoA desaturase (delta-9 desaturase)